MTREEYDRIEGVNWSTLKNLGKSPAHYLHGLTDGAAIERLRALTSYAEKAHAARITAAWERFNSVEGKRIRSARAEERTINAPKSSLMRQYGVKAKTSALPSAA